MRSLIVHSENDPRKKTVQLSERLIDETSS